MQDPVATRQWIAGLDLDDSTKVRLLAPFDLQYKN
jgi:hypothetical protein